MRPPSRKTVPPAGSRTRYPSSFFGKLRRLLFAYMFLAAACSTFTYTNLYLHRHFYSIVPFGTYAPLEGGFIFSSRLNGEPFWGISDDTGNAVVSKVTALKTHGNIIYGQRDLGIAGREYTYFICSYGDDCSDTQNYGDVVLNKELEKMGLPPFNPWRADAREDLLLRVWLKKLVTCPWCREEIIGT